MILDNFWIYFLAFCLSGIIFTYPMEKRENFKRKLVFFAGLAALLGYSVFFIPEENSFFVEATNVKL